LSFSSRAQLTVQHPGDSQPLRLAAVETSTTGGTRLVAMVPPALSMMPLQATNFFGAPGKYDDTTAGHPAGKSRFTGCAGADRAVKPADIPWSWPRRSSWCTCCDTISVLTFAIHPATC